MGSVLDSTAPVWLWNDEVPARVEKCAHELIHNQVKLRPSAVAVDAHDATFTYAELDEASNRLAHYLVELGIRPEDVVPLCFEKSAWAIVSILGVLKAGAAMVFLDPSHPESRKQFITTHVEAKVIICSPQQAHLFETNFPPSFPVSKDTLESLRHYDAAPKTTVVPSNLLYIIFTSGSTGTPKGCLIEHQAFCSGSIRHAERARILPSSRVLQLASYTFDVSILEILTSLIHGACICTPDMATMVNGPAYIVNEYRITWTFMTPSLVKLMAPSMVPTLETLALGGEPLSKIDVETWAGHVQLVNGYGPSECSIAASGNTKMTPDTDPANIGYPVGGICWVVDADDHDVLLPPNTVGELLIEGPILARGYLKNKEKTDEVFIKCPAWGPIAKSGQKRRVYKTGDLAKFLPDGSIYFIGRKDTQVKLRGLRIELGEIEHHIGVHPQVRHRMVVLPKTGLFQNRLVALVSLVDFLSESPESLESTVRVIRDMHQEDVQRHLQSIRENLKSNVPEYMVPETWVVLERFPLLISGKLNRSLVSNWILDADNSLYREIVGVNLEDVPAVEESSGMEEQLRSIYSTVLNLPIENISLQKSFLSLGGDSITAMQVVARCRSARLAVSVKDILRSKSIVELSYCVKSVSDTAYSTEEKFDLPFNLSPVQRMYFDMAPTKMDDSRQTRFHQSFYLKVERPISESSLAKAVQLLVVQHSMLRVRFLQDESGKWTQLVPSQVDDTFSFAAHAIETAKDAFPIIAATQTSLDIQKGPVFAVVLFNTPSEGQHLFLVAHHLTVDLVSWRVILRDLEEVLTVGLLTAQKPLPFQNWLALQSEHESQATDVSYALPFDIPQPNFDYWGMLSKPNRMCDTQELTFALDLAMTKELLEGACHMVFNTEPIDLLLASFIYSFSQVFSDRPVPAMFRVGHGREPWDEDIDISGIVGWFTTMYPLYVDIEESFGILDVVKRAKDVRHSVPGSGRPYFASRYLNEAGIAKFHDHDNVELSFDYSGLYQQMERPDALLTQVPGYQAVFEDVGKEVPRFALVEITAEVIQGQMQLLFAFNKNMKNQDLLQLWIENCKLCLVHSLQQLQNHQQELTLADFPLLRLSYDDLDKLIYSKFSEIGISNIDQVESVYSCSPMQHGMLISQVRSESQGCYEHVHTLKVETRNPSDILDVEALRMAWASVVQRHTSLRTVFVESVSQAGLYDQVVLKDVSPKILIQECQQDEVDQVFNSQGKLVFATGDTLHRFTICRISVNAAICKLEINHAIIDGSSMANLLGDFIQAYDGRINDRNSFKFEAYIKHILSRPLSLATDFWKEYLMDVNPCFFPIMAPWEDASDPQNKLETITIDVCMTPSDLTDFCDAKNITIVNIFQLAWGLVLRKYSGSDDVCFGYLSSGRDAPLNGIEEGVGAFITMLVSRMVLGDSLSLSDALQNVADDLIRALPNQHCGLAEIHHALKLGSQPLFNTIISFHRETDHEMLTDSTIVVEAIQGYDPTEYALSLDVGVTESKINVTLQFWTSQFTKVQAMNIGATLAKAVESTVRESEKAIGEVDLVSSEHLDQLRKITAVYPEATEECVHDAIKMQVLATPGAEAICSYEGSWTYKEVDDQATRLANYLVTLGVGPEVIVPYCFQKSAWAIISMLAILKAGGAAVALDPGHPVNRLEGLIRQTGSRIILAAPRNVHIFDKTQNVEHVVGVDLDFISKLEHGLGHPCPTVKPSNAAFVVFTSGTTGRPKGIVLEHFNLRTCCTAMAPVLGFGPETRTLQFAAYTFDVSLQDIFTTLQTGGTICVVSDEERMNDLAGGINSRRANWADLTATVSGLLRPSDVPTMKRLNNGGEPLNRDVVETWADHVELYNLYGPAETTVNQTASTRLSRTSTATNIGPAYGTHVWIVNEHDPNRLVPIGCIGEILIEGPLLARGYLNDPPKTAAAFIEDLDWVSLFPSSISPRRFYKSGDLGILNSDGSITIVGRRDTQVKINGQRVELDEIMYQVQLLLPEGYQAVIDALSIEEHTKSKTIVAYICSSKFSRSRKSEYQKTIEITDNLRRILKGLQGSLAKVLPFYMIPSIFVPIFDIPYTQSGKMDRTKLRQVASGFSKAQISHYMLRSTSDSQPTTEMEKLFQGLFSRTLGIEAETISRDDNFFGLGGDSVGAMKMVAVARKQSVIIRVSDIFKHPNLHEMASVAMMTGDERVTQDIEPFSLIQPNGSPLEKVVAEAAAQCNISPEDVEDIYPTSALQEGLMALGMRKTGAYIAQKAFRLPRDFDFARFRSAWAKVIEREAILRTRIVHTPSCGNVQVVNKRPLSWREASDLEVYLTADKASTFQYGDALMRLAIVGGSEAYFVWTAHHAIYDGWSISLLFERVVQAYRNETITSSTLFKTFISRLADVPQSACINFWKSEFESEGGFPTSFPVVGLGYVAASKKSITHQGFATGITSDILPSTIKRAAWAMTLATYADSENVIFASTLSGRNISLSGIDTMMGPTITTVPVRVSVPKSGITIRQLLEAVQSQSVSSIEYEHFGLQNIRDISPEARTAVDSITNLFVLQPSGDNDQSFLDMDPLERPEENFDTFPLVVICNLGNDGGFSVEAMYDEKVISTSQMTRILHQYEHFIQILSGDSSRPIEEMSLLNRYDLKDITTWNAVLPDSINARIPDLVLQNVAVRPQAEAISAWDGSVTYQELDLLSSKLANHLVSLGVGPEVKVGLCFDKSIWNIISMFAIMRTGGVCVQLLPTYPMPRILSILDDIEASVVLVSPQHSSLFDGIVPNVLSIEPSFLDSLPQNYNCFNAPEYGPDNAAFIVFTSGSTGKPKGVIIEHSGFCTMAHYQLPQIMLNSDSRVLQFATHTFDICLFESFAPLVTGACVCVPSESDRMNNLVGAINALNVDWIIMVSTVADTFHPDDVQGLKSIILGGEPLRADIHARWASRVNLFNDYGPAECSILAVMTRSTLETPPSMIGKGQGCRTWVADKNNSNRLVPVGCIGELLVEGPLLARGYLKNAEKTAESYIGSPTWTSSIHPLPTRLYKTGDLVCYTSDGNMHCLGRKDTQIKIRGLRVELGEIEHHVKTSSFGAQKQAVEKILLGGDVEKAALAAFVIPSSNDINNDGGEVLPLSANLNTKFLQLRDFIGRSLQSYMVPSLYIPLPRMPETQTGKIDRNALRRIGAALTPEQVEVYSLGHEEDAASKRVPSTPMEMALQSIWAQVLNIDPASIGADDSFFNKGGDSIKAMRITSMARLEGFELIVADIFKNPVLCEMAAACIPEDATISTDTPIDPFKLVSIGSEGSIGTFVEDAAMQCAVEKDLIEDIYPCTSLQEGLMELSTQHESAYTAQRVFRIQDNIDIQRFKNTWTQLVALHPILRTRIVLSKASGAMQVVLKEGVSWQRQAPLSEYLASDKLVSIKYGSPLARYALDSENRYFIWTVHHALYDGHSANLVMEHFEALYNGSQVSTAPGYNRFIKLVKEVDAEQCKAFWSKQLSQGTPNSFPALPSATYQPSPDREVTKTIEIARDAQQGFMLSTILRAAWAIVTSRYMSSEDVAFAATLSGRNAPIQGIECVVGPTITTVPIQLQIGSTSTVAEFLARVQQQATDMIPFEHSGIQNIYAMAGDKLNLKNLFVIQQPLGDLHESKLLDEVLDKSLLRGFHTYAVVVECIVMSESKVDVELQFDHKALPEASARRVLDQFEHVVHELIGSSPSTILKDIGLITLKEFQQIVEWNNMVDIQNVKDCVHQIFQEQVEIRPDAEAVSSWDGCLTYHQLDQLSDKLAVYLAEKGVKPEYLVPMCFDKSMWTVVAMMSVLKAGGACVHLGRTAPIARMMQIIQETGATIVLTDNVHAHQFNGVVEAVVIEQGLLERLSSATPLPRVSPSNPAFVLFTSGSTGKPKGVVVEHGSLCTSSRAHGTNRKVGPHTRLLQFAAYTFDVSVADIFTTLQRGGCICIPSEDERINDLAGAINRMNVNYGFLTPTVAGMLDPKTVPTLKTLILGGELLTQDNIRTWAPVIRLIISYGMTECSIHCVDAVPLTIESDPANLGRPSGCLMWIVDPDDHNKLATIGCVGELVIEGRMVSRGYLNDKEKTNAAFITNPAWAQEASATRRMYKTGDLVKYSAEGEICYVSRKDFQVKHHGQRIELSEIEHHLVADTRVKHAVTLLPKSGYLQKRLITVLSLESSALPLSPDSQLALVSGLDRGIADIQIALVRNNLATIVPEYMVPALWIVVRALPLTPNGKIDRVTTLKWVEEMEEHVYESIAGGAAEEDYWAAPATVQQKQLQELLIGVLGLPSINMNRSFLDLGGDSITAMQLRAKCQAAGISLTVRDILTCESISHLAIEATFLLEEDTAFKEIVGQPFSLTTWQQACIESFTANPTKAQNQTLLLRLESSITVPKVVRAVEALIQQHSMLRARFKRDFNGQWSQVITKELTASYKFEAHTLSTDTDIRIFLQKMEAKLDIERGPSFTVHLFNTTEKLEQQAMAVTIHSLIADTASINIIAQDLLDLFHSDIVSSNKASSFQAWLLIDEARGGGEVLDAPTDLTPWGITNPTQITTNMVEKAFALPSETTSLLLGTSNHALSTRPMDIISAIIARAWNIVFEVRSCSSLFIREDQRSSRTVGQFNRIRQLPKSKSQDFIQILSEFKDARARNDTSLLLTQPLPGCVEVLLEYSDYDIFRPNGEVLQQPQLAAPPAVLKISVTVANGEIMIKFRHSNKLTHQDALSRLIEITEQSIPNLTNALATMTQKATLSDFPLLDMDYSQLTILEKALHEIDVSFSNVEAIVPCTPLQQRMLISQRLTPGAFQSDTAHKITSPGNNVDIAQIQDAWNMVTARHEALRTVFVPSVVRPGEFDQIVLKSYAPAVDVIQCEESSVNEIIEQHTTVSHALFKPHVRFTIFQTSSALYCKLEISHTLQDGMSTRIIYQDLVLAYQGLLPEYPASGFHEYVSWLANHDMTPSNEFWTNYLSESQTCHIPQSSNRGGSKGENRLMPIDLAVSATDIAQLCRKHQLTPATLFQAAWVLVLRAFTGSDDVLFGYVTANRELDLPGVDEIVGPMINMLACRMQLPQDTATTDPMTAYDLLRDTQASFLETLPYQHGLVAAAAAKEQRDGVLPWNSVLSIEYAAEETGAAYYPSTSSVNSGSADPAGGDTSSPLGFETLYGTRAPEFDVVLGALIGERCVEVQLGYWDGLMDEEMMVEMAGMYRGIVEEWVQGEDLSGAVSQMAALTRRE
ncbi:acetyl-CoA synthetase-like protein [Glonium stellatum]|uniref:Acetyl-CoA synthetase-like protein n=1 Tax=Glonium stellatum TaxID=574774 RepID=A0A8E2ETE2_9PEZI|nr:acetyl-CoA synthetase-like protein [Glonium stellatum]